MTPVLVDTNVVSYRFKNDTRGDLYTRHLVGRVPAVPFVAVDVAQTAAGRWVVVELNDGQDSGYRAVPPLPLWQRVVAVEQSGGVVG